MEGYESKGISRGGILFLDPETAIELTRRCRANGIRVLGIDGFIVTADYTQPLLEHSIDLSSEPNDVDGSCIVQELWMQELSDTRDQRPTSDATVTLDEARGVVHASPASALHSKIA